MRQSEILARARRIRAVVSDVDGVLTDGGIIYGTRGTELKRFHARDGLGIILARRAGLKVFLVSGRSSAALARRSRELGVDRLWQRAGDKGRIRAILCTAYGLAPEELCCIGDDLPDLALVAGAGLGVAVAGAPGELRKAACLVTAARGGEGAFREVVELILKAQGRWEDALRAYRP
ncbi:MAG: HAD hydrolase family protein [Candidatus Aureabacteria bacterium]|nr:HAD hydrolase family protein [Candidatus Auribacterota bacterium]